MKLPHLLNIRKSIHSKIFLSFILVIMLPSIIIGISSYYISINILTQKVSSSFSETVLYVRNSVERELYQIKQISDYIFIDKDIKEAILKKYTHPYESIEAEERVQRKFENYVIANIFNNIKVVKIYGLNGFEMSFGDNGEIFNLDNQKIVNSEWYKAVLQNTAKTLWAGMHESFLKERGATPKYSISLFRVIKDPYYQHNIGVIYVSLQPEIFSNLTANLHLNNKSEIYILDNHDKIVNNPNSKINVQEIYHILEKNNNVSQQDYLIKEDKKTGKMFFYYFINDFNWKVVGMIPISELTRDNKIIFNVTGAAFLVSFIFSSIIWYFISYSIVGPVKRLTRATKYIRDGNFNIKVQCSSRDELGILTNNFNYMIEKINDLLKQVLEEHTRKKDAEYKALQAQINPHFLYNTLNSIRWMAMIQKADNIKNVVDALGRLLRSCTSKVDQYITIGEEIDNLKDYIYIEKIAYKNKFQVEWDVDEEVLQYKCIKFILQPLVENAIFHGILPKERYGTIWISAKKQNDFIMFSVKDDGDGMTKEQIKDLLSADRGMSKKFSGIGISNVNERIQMTYGGCGTLDIESEKGEYTNIIIKIPIFESQ